MFFAAVAAVALTVSAAAGDNVRGVTDNEIVIGTHTDLSGVTAMWGVNNTNAWRMVFDEANAMERAGVKLFAWRYGKKRICAMSQDTDFGRDVMDGARDERMS